MYAVPHPSGRQYGIRNGDQRATVTQVGAGLRSYEVDGFSVFDGFDVDELATAARGQVLAPWPNRLGDGTYRFAGQTLQVPLSEPSQRNAIHGLVRWNGWELLHSSPARVRLGHVLWPQAGYPFTLALEVIYELTDSGLRVTICAENAGRQPAPYGAGQHPYVRAELGSVDRTHMRLPAGSWLEMDERQLPTGQILPVAGSALDFRDWRPIGSTRLDTAFTHLERGPDGLARVELRSGDGARVVTVWMDAGFEHLMIFTGDTLSEAERRRSVGVEPMTCAPNAFQNGLGLRTLEPGQRTEANWGIEVG